MMQLPQRLDLGVGDAGIIGRRVSVMTSSVSGPLTVAEGMELKLKISFRALVLALSVDSEPINDQESGWVDCSLRCPWVFRLRIWT
jgi:hypothetical protein